jgi:hypothetical protein
MASVYIDIPNIGTVEAKNAASEATLLAILAAMKAQKGRGAAGDNKSADAEKEDLKAKKQSTGAFSKLAKGTGMVIGGMDRLSTALTGTIKQFADVGDSVESAAGIFKDVPIIGGMFGAVATAVTKVTDSFQTATSSGATFGGSIQSFSRSASAAGMTMDKFGALIARNGAGMLAFGSNVDSGAKRFSQISKQIRSTSSDLYALGYNTTDINQGLAKYGELLRIQGRQGTQSNAQLAVSAKNYMKEMDALAKATGMERAQIEEKFKQTQQDAQFHAFMSSASEDVRKSFAGLITTADTASPELASMIKDYVTTGSFTNAENAKTAGLMGAGSQAALQELRDMALRGEKITAAKQDEIFRRMEQSSNQMMSTTGRTLAATSGEFDHAIKTNIGLNKLRDASLEKSKEAQNAATKNTDGLNAAIEQNKAALAGLSNEFQMALANSGILDLMMNAFQFLANLTQTYLIPAFNIMATIVTSVGGFLLENLKPVFEWLTGFIRETMYPAFLKLAGIFIVDLLPIIKTTGRALSLLGGIVYDYAISPLMKFAGVVLNNVMPVLSGLGVALGVYAGIQIPALIAAMTAQIAATWALVSPMLVAALPFITIGLVVANLVLIFKKLYDSGWSFGTALEAVGDKLYDIFVLGMKDLFISILSFLPQKLGGYSKEEEEIARKKIANERKELKDRETLRDAERKQTAAGRDKQKKRDEVSNKIDQKITSLKESSASGLAEANKKEKAALEEKMDYNSDSISLLGQELKKQKSSILPAAPTTKASDNLKAAESGRKSLEVAGEKKAADAAKVPTTDAEAKQLAAGTAKKAATAATQESAETLLASLNTKLDRLIQVSQQHAEIGTRQLSVQQGLSGNLLASI